MTYLTVTEIAPAQISGTLSTDNNSFSIPLKIAGTGMAHFRTNNRDEKLLELSPDLIHVLKNGILQFSMTEIRVTKMFGKTLLEGVNTQDWHSPLVIDLSKIKQMWTDSYSRQCDVWHIEI
jgi:hypothetical protein